ncbi:MAG: SGNH/GDSL hydrolase family protein, partial [Tannerellaceae bacterium]
KKRVNKKVIYEPNAKVAKVRDVLIDYAKEKGIAYWDLYEVTGGKGSCKNWYSSKLMSRDRIHFTQDGYQLQGDLLYNALISGYNEYVANRNRLQ